MITDFHSHILPGVDDGSSCVAESVKLLQMEAEQGVRRVVATPHFYPQHDTPERFLRRREKAMQQLREGTADCTGLPEVILGAEVLFFSGISDSDQVLRLTIGEKRCILIEMPLCTWTNRMYQELEDIYVKHGIMPIIAHVDRYIRPHRTQGIPERLAEMPVMVQANASFFARLSTRRMALKMLRKQQIHVLGSDCHNLSDRKPNLQTAEQIIQTSLGLQAVEWIRNNEETVFSLSNS